MGVVEAIAGEGDGDVVTAVFAFLAYAGGEPPDGGVVEEEGFDDALDQVHEIVVAADVGEFVSEEVVEMFDGHACDGGDGYQDDRA